MSVRVRGGVAAVAAAAAIVGLVVAAGDPDASATVADDAPPVAASLTVAREAFAAGDFPAALRAYEAVSDADPGNAEANAYAGWIAFLGDDHAAGLERLEDALLEAPFYPDAHLLRGLVLLRGFDDGLGAAAEFEIVMRLDPDGVLGAAAERWLAKAHGSGG